MEAQQETLTLLYPEDTIRRYFGRGADRHLAQFTRSIVAANEFLSRHPRKTLTAGRGRPEGLTRALQYYKDETFLTLYAFISLDLAGKPEHLKERERLYAQLLRQALPDFAVTVTEPALELEKLVVPPKAHLDVLAQRFREMAYLTKGVFIRFTDLRDDGHEQSYYFDSGIEAFVRQIGRTRQPCTRTPST